MIDKGFYGNRLYVSVATQDKLIKKYLTNIDGILKKFKKLYMKKNLKKYIKICKISYKKHD